MDARTLAAAGVLALAAGCSSGAGAASPAPGDPMQPPPGEVVPPPAAPTEALCLPLGTCGCFAEPLCAAGRLREDGFTVDFESGPHSGGTGTFIHECPRSDEPCFDYFDWAQICAVERFPATDRAKYLCSMDDTRPKFSCAFVDGACVPIATPAPSG